MSDWNKKVIAEFRANGGKVGGNFEGSTLVLVHTIGRKSGNKYIIPLMCGQDGDRLIIIASKGGAPTHPDWYHNLVANPTVEVEFGTERFVVEAAVLDEPDRTEQYEKMADRYAFFHKYREEAGRVIPVFGLTPVENG